MGRSNMEYSFSGAIWYWHGPAPFHFVSIPLEMSEEIKAESGRLSYGWGAIAVVCRSGDVEWKTAIFPKDGLYLVPIKDAVRNALEVESGDLLKVDLAITPK